MFSLRPLPATLTGIEPFYLIATWFQSGRIRPASGSWGSLAAWPFCWFLKSLGGWQIMAIFAIGAFFGGIWAINQYTSHTKQTDPSEVVIDEVVGMAILWMAVPASNVFLAVVGFIAFRIFDAIKRGPVGWCDKHIKGAPGVIVDDVVAGFMAAGGIWIILALFY